MNTYVRELILKNQTPHLTNIKGINSEKLDESKSKKDKQTERKNKTTNKSGSNEPKSKRTKLKDQLKKIDDKDKDLKDLYIKLYELCVTLRIEMDKEVWRKINHKDGENENGSEAVFIDEDEDQGYKRLHAKKTEEGEYYQKIEINDLLLYDRTICDKFKVGSIESYSGEFFDLIIKNNNVSDKKHSKFLKLFTNYLWKYVKKHKSIQLPDFNGNPVETPEELYTALWFAEKLGDVTWNDIYEDHEKLNLYLFDITRENLVSHLNDTLEKLGNEWSGISFIKSNIVPPNKGICSDQTIINNFAENYSKPIIDKALKHPLFRYYFATDVMENNIQRTPLTHINEVREILKQIVHVEKNNNIQIDPPITATLHFIKRNAIDVCKNYEFTYREFLYIAGWVAQQSAEVEGYFIENALDKLKNKSSEIEELKPYSDICVDVANALSCPNFLTVMKNKDKFKFRTRSYRLICAAYYASNCLNEIELTNEEQTSKFLKEARTFLTPYLNRYLQNSDSCDLIVLGEDFFTNSDAAVFYAVTMISCLTFNHRQILIRSICEQEASDFSVKNRATQELYIYILVSILCTYDIELSRDCVKHCFEKSYGMTLYSFSMIQLDALLNHSKFFLNEIDRAKTNALTPINIKGTDYAEPPLYNYIYGKSSEKNLCTSASEIQYQTFGMGSDSKNNIVDIGNLLLRLRMTYDSHNLQEDRKYEITKETLDLALATHLLGYAMMDIKNRSPEVTLTDFKDKNGSSLSAKQIIELFIWSDFTTKRVSFEYNKDEPNYKNVYLPCGTYRLICSFEAEKLPDSRIELDQKISAAYTSWLSKEIEHKNIRYAMLMSRLLMCTDFYTNNSTSKTLEEIIRENISPEDSKSIVLPYDNFDKYIESVFSTTH